MFVSFSLAFYGHRTASEKELVIINKASWQTSFSEERSQFSIAGAKSVQMERVAKGYCLYIEMPTNERHFIGARRSRIELHNVAEAVAKHLGLPLIDNSMGIQIARPPDRLDESLRERTKRRGERLTLANIPENLHCEYFKDDKCHRFVISAPGFTGVYLVFTALGLVLTGLLVSVFIAPSFSADEPNGLLFFGLPLVLIVLYYVLDVVQGATSREEIIVSKNELEVHYRSYLGHFTESLPARQIEELNVVDCCTDGGTLWSLRDFLSALSSKWELLVRSDKMCLHLGRRLPKEQIEWMSNVIEYVLSS